MFLIPIHLKKGNKILILSMNFIGSSEFYSLEDGKKNDVKEIRKPYSYALEK